MKSELKAGAVPKDEERLLTDDGDPVPVSPLVAPVVGTVFDCEPDPAAGEPGQIDRDIKPLVVGHRPGSDDLVGQDLPGNHDPELPVTVWMVADAYLQFGFCASRDIHRSGKNTGCFTI